MHHVYYNIYTYNTISDSQQLTINCADLGSAHIPHTSYNISEITKLEKVVNLFAQKY